MNLKKTQKCPRRPTIFELCSLRRSLVQDESEADNSHLRETKRSRSRARPDLSGQATTKVRISHHRSLRLAIAVAHEGRNKSISVQVARHLFSMNAPGLPLLRFPLATCASNTRRPHQRRWAGIITGRSLTFRTDDNCTKAEQEKSLPLGRGS